MRYIPEDIVLEDQQLSGLPLSRQSRFQEHLSSTHTLMASPHNGHVFAAQSSPQYQTPIHIIRRLSRERQRQYRLRDEVSVFDRSSPESKSIFRLKLKGYLHRPKFMSKVGKPHKCHKRAGSTTTLSSLDRRRNITTQKIYAHHFIKRARKDREKEARKRHKARFKGTMWGYDSTAGRITTSQAPKSSQQSHNIKKKQCARTGFYIFRGAERHSQDSDEYGSEETDELGRRTGKSWVYGDRWGIESGGPGRTTHFSIVNVQDIQESAKGKERADGLARGTSQRSGRNPWRADRGSDTS